MSWLLPTAFEVGAFDLDVDKVRQLKAKNLKIFATWSDLISWKPTHVLVATPPISHRVVVERILAHCYEAKILIEKPLASNLEDGRKLLEASKTFPGQLYGVCNLRFHPAVAEIRRNLAKLGRPIFSKTHFSHKLSQMRASGNDVFASKSDQGGGVVLDCVHDIDIATWLLGPMEHVVSRVATIGGDDIDAEDYALVMLKGIDDVVSSFHFDFIGRLKKRGCEIVGTEASICWESEGKNPESSQVVLQTTDHKQVLFEEHKVDASLQYRQMLSKFLGNAEDLQSIEEAYSVLELAISINSHKMQN